MADVDVAPPGSGPEVGPSDDGEAAERPRWVVPAYVISGVLAAIPLVRMIGVVRGGSELQFADYWFMLDSFVDPDGSIDVRGLLVFQNEHPVVIPKIIYWLNARAFAGSNITLGFVVIAITCAQIGVLAAMLRRAPVALLAKLAVFVFCSAVFFDLVGTWSFFKSMSGTAWLTANVFATAAIALRARDRRVLAAGFAVLASVSYGTGVIAWLCLVLVGMVRRPPREWWREWPYAVGFVATYLWMRSATDLEDKGGRAQGVVDTLRVAAGQLGYVFDLDGNVGQVVGAAVLVGVPVMVLWLGLIRRSTAASGWVGVATFGWLATLLIAYGRGGLTDRFGLAGRYNSLAALTWVGFMVLLLIAIEERTRSADAAHRPVAEPGRVGLISFAVVLLAAVAATAGGRDELDELEAAIPEQELREVALRVGIVDGTKYLVVFNETTFDDTAILEAIGHHPFVDDWGVDCGLLGEVIDPSPAGSVGVAGEVVSTRMPDLLPEGQMFAGYVADPRVECVVATGRDGEVIGAGVVGVDGIDRVPEEEGVRGFRGFVPRGAGPFEVVAVLEDGALAAIGTFSDDGVG